ncbi:nuclease-related domain-containing protein [Sporosarcina sp. P26b]|uniref:nuclease-related domain-containing protein n=1 Tax=Sporosarcina sp. P26b TaxID=2048253 RepID=UPI0013041307|nr:nuclease-related domain-containing protein [Sporosarcina sp. P26b]
MKRLPVDHEKYEKIRNDFYNGKAGFGGEREFDYQLRDFIPPYPHAILHDVFLKHEHAYFQIDSILITPSAIVLFEIKNMAGKLHIKQNPTQFIRESVGGERTVLRSPIEEMERKKHYLTSWLQARNLEIPLIDYIVFAYQNELTIENTSSHRLVFSYEIPNRLRNMEMKEELLTADQIKRLANELMKAHRQYDPFPLIEKYGLSIKDLATGVACTNCQQLTMLWRTRSWQCRACGHRDRHAHHATLAEWYCISGGQLTNRQFRHFANISSRHIAKRMLANSYTEMSGIKRHATYQLSPQLLKIRELSL